MEGPTITPDKASPEARPLRSKAAVGAILVVAVVLLAVAAAALFGFLRYRRTADSTGEQSSFRKVSASDGGTVLLEGLLEVEVPPGALREDAQVTLSRVEVSEARSDLPEGARPLGPAVRLDLGGVRLERPVNLRFFYDPAHLPTTTDVPKDAAGGSEGGSGETGSAAKAAGESRLVVFYLGETASAWATLPGRLEGGRVAVSVEGPGLFRLGIVDSKAALCPPVADRSFCEFVAVLDAAVRAGDLERVTSLVEFEAHRCEGEDLGLPVAACEGKGPGAVVEVTPYGVCAPTESELLDRAGYKSWAAADFASVRAVSYNKAVVVRSRGAMPGGAAYFGDSYEYVLAVTLRGGEWRIQKTLVRSVEPSEWEGQLTEPLCSARDGLLEWPGG